MEVLANLAWVYRRNPAVIVEDFGERSLALHCEDLRLVELNVTARELFSRLNGQSSLEQVATSLAALYDQPLESILEDVRLAAAAMAELGLVVRVSLSSQECSEEAGA